MTTVPFQIFFKWILNFYDWSQHFSQLTAAHCRIYIDFSSSPNEHIFPCRPSSLLICSSSFPYYLWIIICKLKPRSRSKIWKLSTFHVREGYKKLINWIESFYFFFFTDCLSSSTSPFFISFLLLLNNFFLVFYLCFTCCCLMLFLASLFNWTYSPLLFHVWCSLRLHSRKGTLF